MRILLSTAKVAIAIVIATNLLSACGDAVKTIDIDPKDLANVKKNTTLPTGFPVPIYNNAKVINVIELPSNVPGKKGYSVTLESTDSVRTVDAYYATTLHNTGWAAKPMDMPGMADIMTLFATKDSHQVMLTMMGTNGKTTITINWQPIAGR